MNRKPNCVASFVADAIIEHSRHGAMERHALAARIEEELAVQVGRPVTNLTVTSAEALCFLPTILSTFDPRFRFAIYPFRTIPFALYDTMLDDLRKARFSIGAGVRANVIFGGISDDLHVIRVLYGVTEGVVLVDDDFQIRQTLINWERFEHAVNTAHSGYWTIGIDGEQ